MPWVESRGLESMHFESRGGKSWAVSLDSDIGCIPRVLPGWFGHMMVYCNFVFAAFDGVVAMEILNAQINVVASC